MVTVASTFLGKMPLKKAHRYVKAQNGTAEIDQPKVFSYMIKVWEELIALIKTSALT